MKSIVTGGAGFIGSHLVDRLVKEGHEVTIIDNLSNGRLLNIEHHKGNSKVKFVHKDVSDLAGIREEFKGVDWVFHLAALADIVPSIQHPAGYYQSNVTGTFSVLEASKSAGVKRFVYAASSSCYGIPPQYPTPETAPTSPEYPYALTKYLGEQLVMHWGLVYKLPVVSLRFFNVYGPRSRTSGTYGAVFGVFLAQKLKNKPFTVVGTGEQTRDFTFVSDVVDACYTAANSGIKGEIFNVGSGRPVSVNHLVKLLGGGEVVHLPKRPGEPDSTHADVSKIQKLLNWKSRVSIEDGVKVLLDNIDYWKEAPVWTQESIAEATKEWFAFLSK